MLDEMRKFIRSRRNCVMATVDGDSPHCSLMSYLVEDDCRFIYVVSKINTKKYQNILQNPKVSLLIDDRASIAGGGQIGLGEVKALTIHGECFPLEDPGRAGSIKRLFSIRYPHLEGLLAEQDIAVLYIEVHDLRMMEGALKANYANMD